MKIGMKIRQETETKNCTFVYRIQFHWSKPSCLLSNKGCLVDYTKPSVHATDSCNIWLEIDT